MKHNLKTWPEVFQPLLDGRKTAEFRKDDRTYKFEVDDALEFREWDPESESFTGRKTSRLVTHVLRGPAFGVPEGYVVLSLNVVPDGYLVVTPKDYLENA